MPFSRPTLATIYDRMIADYEQRLADDGPVSAISRKLGAILIAVFAGSVYACYGFLVKLSRQFFFTTAETEYLEWHARKYGLPRKVATKATGRVQFTGTNGTPIPAGTEVQRSDGFIYVTDSLVTISGGRANVDCTASEAGTIGNDDTGADLSLVSPISGIDSTVTITQEFDGGTEEETNSELVTRLLQRTQNPPGSGNEGDYQRWALEVAGIGRAWTKTAADWYGAGTVGVIIATSTLETVSPTIFSNVETYIETKRPVGADVTISDPVPINITFDISITPNTSELQTAINDALNEVFLIESEPGETLKISALRQAIGNSGVDDYEITEIYKDGTPQGVGDIVTTNLDLARFQSVTYSTL